MRDTPGCDHGSHPHGPSEVQVSLIVPVFGLLQVIGRCRLRVSLRFVQKQMQMEMQNHARLHASIRLPDLGPQRQRSLNRRPEPGYLLAPRARKERSNTGLEVDHDR